MQLLVVNRFWKTHPPVEKETWAFCGIHPDDPSLNSKYLSLQAAGIDATMGPCMPAPVDYSPAYPGSRYLSPEGYLQVVINNAQYGLKTIVYDDRIWSDNWEESYQYWAPHKEWIRAWDMSDEWDTNDSQLLESRWNLVLDRFSSLGIGPFTNNLPMEYVAEHFVGWQRTHYSFDDYRTPENDIRSYDPRVDHLMCAVNTFKHLDFDPKPSQITKQMLEFSKLGCDSFLIFGGTTPYDNQGFSQPVGWEAAVKKGSK